MIRQQSLCVRNTHLNKPTSSEGDGASCVEYVYFGSALIAYLKANLSQGKI